MNALTPKQLRDAETVYAFDRSGRTYYRSNKRGTNRRTGRYVREYAADDGDRLWVGLDGVIYQDGAS